MIRHRPAIRLRPFAIAPKSRRKLKSRAYWTKMPIRKAYVRARIEIEQKSAYSLDNEYQSKWKTSLKRFVTYFANLIPTSVIGGCLIPLLLISNPLSVVSAAAQTEKVQTDPRVDEFLATINRSIVALAGKSEAEASRICGQIVSSAVNVDALARSGGSRIMDRMSQRQRTAYLGAVERRAVRDCISQNRDNDGQPLVFAGVRQGEGGAHLLATRSNTANQTHTVIWRLRGDGRRLRAVDILFDGRSAALAFRDEINTLLDRHNEDIDAVIEAFSR